MSSLNTDTSFDQQQIVQDLLHQKSMIEAQLASIQSVSVSSLPMTSHERRQSAQEAGPRSYSYNGQSMSRTISSARSHHESTPMSGSRSQRPLTAMSRTGSKHTSSTGSMPFSNTGQVPLPLHVTGSQQETSIIDSWTTGHGDPMTACSFHQLPLAQSLSRRQSELEQVAEIDSGEHPSEYFARIGAMPMVSVIPSATEISNGDRWRDLHQRDSFSQRRPSFGIQTPTTPSTTTLSIGTTASDLSRQSSICNDSILGSFEMMNVHSNSSYDGRSYQTSIPLTPSSSTYKKLTSLSEDQSFFLAGACGASEETQFPLSPDDFRGETTQYPSLVSLNGSMKRSPSNESTSSLASTKSRATTMLKRQNQMGTRPLASKAALDGHEMSRDESHTLMSTTSENGLENKNVAAIPKAAYKRPKHQRIFCDQCNEHSEGFRGPHELGRHQDREHKGRVAKFVCIEPVDGVINPQYQPINPLSKCKSCTAIKKKYGIYYNAAAHLRRTHFRPKARGRGRASKIEDKSDKRTGKPEREWPPMNELKRWMKVVYEDAEPQEDDSTSSDNDDEVSTSFNVEEYNNGQDISAENLNNYIDKAMLNAFVASSSNFNNLGMQNMQHENLPLQPSIDHTTMHIDSSQSSFPESQFTSMNGDMSYMDDFPQHYDDHSIGPDLFNTFQYSM